MSTYQYYEFQAVDRPLTAAEQKEVASLSSRVELHPRTAVFEYSYADFPDDPHELLAGYYDALFYIANWGAVTLAFRFPAGLIDTDRLDQFELEESIWWEKVGDYLILIIQSNRENDWGWIDGNGLLTNLLPLRASILSGDFRVLYLAWLSMMESWLDDEDLEPPVPADLRKVDAPLKQFLMLFPIEEDLLTVAADHSFTANEKQVDWAGAVTELSLDEAYDWLERFASNKEPLLFQQLRRRLLPDDGALQQRPRRTVGALTAAANELRQKKLATENARQAAARRRQLETLAANEPAYWEKIETLILAGAPQYGEVVALLKQMHALAKQQSQERSFTKRMEGIRSRFSRRSSLMRQLDKAGL